MGVHHSLDTCLLEVLEHAANDDCIVRETMRPWKMAPSGSFFGQVLLFIKVDRPDGPKFTRFASLCFLGAQRWTISARKIAMPIYPNFAYLLVPGYLTYSHLGSSFTHLYHVVV
jgi:hypothetical protein